ncbi:C-type lectin galactose-binding isoform [Zeugodacus cucurbitae]|nr:C-type lectin galactose-binding isoform [Zeugodacus cucurbitae]
MLQSTKLLLLAVIFMVIGGNQLMAKFIGPSISQNFNYTNTKGPVVSASSPNPITTTVRSTTSPKPKTTKVTVISTTSPKPKTTKKTVISTTTPKPKTTEAPNAYNHPKFHLAKQKLNWFGATVYCKERNWKLIVLDSEKIRKEFESYLTKYNLRKYPFWTAGNQLADMKTWRWGLDGSKLTYSHWAKHQPDNYKNQQHCIKLFANSLEWDDDTCERAINFVCLKH